MKNQVPTTLTKSSCLSSPSSSNTSSHASIIGLNRNPSISKGAIKVVLPPSAPPTTLTNSTNSKITNTLQTSAIESDIDGLSSFNTTDENVDFLNDPQRYYDGNNYYSTKTSMTPMISKHSLPPNNTGVQVIDAFGQNRFSSFSFDSGRGSEQPLKAPSMPTTSNNRASIQSYESFGSTSSNKDSESSQQSSISSSSTSSSFCSSTSSSSSCPSNSHSNRTSSPSSSVSSNIDSFTTSNNVFLKMKPATNSGMLKTSFVPPVLRDNLMVKAGPLTIAEMLLHGVSDSEMIHVWLQKINMTKYEKNFIDAAYDLPTIVRMNPQDLIAIGVTDPKARSIFTAEIQKLKVPENLPSYRPATLEEWLKLLNLDCYYQNLCQQGYRTIDRVTELTWEDLEDVGINKLGHQKKILLAIKKIKSFKTNESENENVDSCSSATTSSTIYSTTNKASMHFEPITIDTNKQEHVNNQQQPYQDVMIKMYANNVSNSPNHIDRTQMEICNINDKRNILPSPIYFDAKSRMYTFQQQQQQNKFNVKNQIIDQYSMQQFQQQNQFPLNQINYSRRRSLESLNTNEALNAGSCSTFPNNCTFNNNKPTYQYSNCDLTNSAAAGISRQTICFENNSFMMNTPINTMPFVSTPFDINESAGTSTLNRPKILMKNNRFILPNVPITNNQPKPDIVQSPVNCLMINQPSPNDATRMNSSNSDIYGSFKKKPPPPPRRINSIREPNSMPTTPTHSLDRTKSFNNHYNSNLDYSDYYLLYRQNSLKNDSFFASCVKSLTNNFSETQSTCQTDPDNQKTLNNDNQMKQSRTIPLNSKDKKVTEHFQEQLNISSSSSGESMYFAHDNVGTIRQRPNNFPQQQITDVSHRPSSSSSSSSTPSNSIDKVLSSFTNNSQSLPLTSNNQPSLVTSNNQVVNNYSDNNSSKNIVDSLEHIEMMLATLKTQLDSIE